MRTRVRILGAIPVLVLLVLLAAGCGDGEKPVIRIHAPQSESQWVNNAIAEFVIENGYGYPVETVEGTTLVMQVALPKGELDLNLSRDGHVPRSWMLTRDPFLLETSMPGIFAAGDVRQGAINRVAAAVGQGGMVISFVHEFLKTV